MTTMAKENKNTINLLNTDNFFLEPPPVDLAGKTVQVSTTIEIGKAHFFWQAFQQRLWQRIGEPSLLDEAKK